MVNRRLNLFCRLAIDRIAQFNIQVSQHLSSNILIGFIPLDNENSL